MRNTKQLEIVTYLRNTSNKDVRKSVDDVIEYVYEDITRDAFIKIEKESKDEREVVKRKGWHRNSCRKTVNANLQELMRLGLVKTSEEDMDVTEIEENTEAWYRKQAYYYNHPVSLAELKTLIYTVLELDSTQAEVKLRLIHMLANCAGSELSKGFLENLKQTSPEYLLKIQEENALYEKKEFSFQNQIWSYKKIFFDTVDVIKNIEKISNILLQSNTNRSKITFQLINFNQNGDRETINHNKIYSCYPLYLLCVGGRFWLVSIFDTNTNEFGYHTNLNFTPLDIIINIKENEEKKKITDYEKISNLLENPHKLTLSHQIAGKYLSYEPPLYVIIKVKYVERMERIPFDLIYRSFGEEFSILQEQSTDYVRILVYKSPYAIMQWALNNWEMAEIEGFYNKKGEEITKEYQRLQDMVKNLANMYHVK